jgi:hypothetical protein
MSNDVGGAPLGAYGVAPDPPPMPALLVPAADDWPHVTIRQRKGRPQPVVNRLDDERAVLGLLGGARLEIGAAARLAVFTVPEPLGAEELVHPYLAPVGAVFAWWRGREAFHAGAFVHGGGAWAVLGEKGAGKSTALASLAREGLDVVCDDMLVVDGERALAGPRCIDLRESAAGHLGTGTRVLRPPELRWRVPLPPIEPAVPLAGWIFLEWGPEPRATPIPPGERLARLAGERSMFVELRDPVRLLELAGLPAWCVSRPAAWDSLRTATELMLRVATS